MWTCPRCERRFQSVNQSHFCGVTTLDALFDGRPADMVLAFDRILAEVMTWEPCDVGPAKKAVVFTSRKAWLIARPMKKELDLKFYHGESLRHPRLHKVSPVARKYAHHIRVKNEEEVDWEVFGLLKKGHEYSLQ